MKHLLLVRHAKSSWDDPEQRDFDRPLNERGKRNASEMGKRLLERHWKTDMLISSPAKRAIKTARLLARETGYDEDAIVQEMSIYEASIDDLKYIVKVMDERVNNVMLVGHNPGMSQLAMLLTGNHGLQLPTCGMVAISLRIKHWKELRPDCGNLLWFDYPKKDPSDPD